MLKKEILEQNTALTVIIHIADLSAIESLSTFYEELSDYYIEACVNSADFGYYITVQDQDIKKIQTMLQLNVEALTILSTLYVRDYQKAVGAQLINIFSTGGYSLVPNGVTYCLSKFYVSSFTEGLAWELKASGAKLQAKVLAPATTQTEFGKVANSVMQYNYDQVFGTYHTAKQMAEFLIALYDSDTAVGCVDRETFAFSLSGSKFQYAGNSGHNQKLNEEQ